jgi:hypothetical protein
MTSTISSVSETASKSARPPAPNELFHFDILEIVTKNYNGFDH